MSGSIDRLVDDLVARDTHAKNLAKDLGLIGGEWDFESHEARHNFIDRVKGGKLVPDQKTLTAAPLRVLWDALVDRHSGTTLFTPGQEGVCAELLVRVKAAVAKDLDTATKDLRDVLNDVYVLAGNKNKPLAEVAKEMAPVLATFRTRSWSCYKDACEKGTDEMRVAFEVARKLRSKESVKKAQITRKENLAQGIKGLPDPLIGIIAHADMNRLRRYKLSEMDPKRFALVENLWVTSPSDELRSQLLRLPKALAEKHRMVGLMAYIDCKSYWYGEEVPKMTLEEWRQMDQLHQATGLEKFLKGRLKLNAWPPTEEVDSLRLVSLLSDENERTELSTWCMMRRLTALAGRPDARLAWQEAPPVERFTDALGEDFGKKLYLLLDGYSNISLKELMEIVEELPDPATQKIAARLTARFLIATDYDFKCFRTEGDDDDGDW